MSKPIKQTVSAEEQAHIDNAIANIRRRTRGQPENDNISDNDLNSSPPDHDASRSLDPGAGDRAAPLKHRGRGKNQAREADDYEVGYGKPPVKTQFQPGQSGNRKGRPKASRNVNTIIRDSMFKLREATIDGKKQRMTQLEIGIYQLINKFMTGDAKAAGQVFALLTKMEELGGSVKGEESGTPAAPPLTQSGRRMIARHHSDLFREAGISEEQIGKLLEGLGLPVPDPGNSAGRDSDGHATKDQDDDIQDDEDDEDDVV